MAGFFKGLFGGRGKGESKNQSEVTPRRETGAYFLNSDDARTYGDVDYMRTTKKVRRTFPKTVNNAEMEMEKEISSMNANNPKLGTQVPKVSMGSIATSNSSTSSASSNSSNGSVPTDAQVAARRKSDSSLDMFRNMAKDLRK